MLFDFFVSSFVENQKNEELPVYLQPFLYFLPVKFFLSIFIPLLNFSVHAQSEWMVKLSTQDLDARVGVWTKGDYSILVSLDSLSSHLRRSQHDLKRSIDYYVDKDSNLLNYFTATAQRYNVAATLTENAKNSFNLNTLIIYEGIENSKRNLEDFAILERYLKQCVEQGKAIVLFKGERIFTLCYQSESNYKGVESTVSDILNNGYTTKAFYDQPDNCLFYEYTHLGW